MSSLRCKTDANTFRVVFLQSNLKKQIEETKIPKTKKCGILPFVTKFEVSWNERVFNFRFCYNKLHRYPPFRNLQAFQKASSRTRIVVMTLTRRIIILLKSCSATLSEWLMNTRRHRGQWSWWVSLLGTGRWGFLLCAMPYACMYKAFIVPSLCIEEWF